MTPQPITSISIVTANDADAERWDAFVSQRPDARNFHRWGWKRVIERSMGWPCYYLMATTPSGELAGILPLVWQSSFLFGSFLTSLPFFNSGGMLAVDAAVEKELLEEAIVLAKRVKARYIELRHRTRHELGLPRRSDKLTVVRPVAPDPEQMFQEFDKKLRADVRKAIKAGFTVDFGGAEFVDDFYRVFAANMRDLGTPVYGISLFREIAREFPHDTYICRVRLGREVAAASFLAGYRDSVEAVWSSSLRKHLSLKPNMFLYWNLLGFAGQKGYREFDFGRSTVGSGTHRFKMQWGSTELPLYWDYWSANAEEQPDLNPHNPKYELAIKVWQRLPIAITKLIGPRIVKRLP